MEEFLNRTLDKPLGYESPKDETFIQDPQIFNDKELLLKGFDINPTPKSYKCGGKYRGRENVDKVSKFIGVSKHGSGWQVQVGPGGPISFSRFRGSFSTEVEAARIHD